MASYAQGVRRGLPRVPGGAAWPPVGGLPLAEPPLAELVEASGVTPFPSTSSGNGVAPTPSTSSGNGALSTPAAGSGNGVNPRTPPAGPAGGVGPALRRGLPRVPGGEPWPPLGEPPAGVPAIEAPTAAEKVPAEKVPAEAVQEVQDVREAVAPPPAAPTPTPTPEPALPPAPSPTRSPLAARVAETPAAPAPAPEAGASATGAGAWLKRGVLILLGAIAAAGIIVLAARGVTTLPGVPEFLRRYPGEYAPAAPTEDGFPLWARWSHFFNLFLMVLIIRSGLIVRHQKKPPAFYAPRRGGKKVSLYLWLHTSLDLLWLLNGVVFVVLLFVSGHWLRIVPTSWEVFPNAASALLQYLTLDWPTEHAWVNYNSLQQLMYFVVVFIAAPVAAITGVRMSAWWPEQAERVNRLYPAPVARAVHFPTMLFFALFIVIHVFLVFATGALRNLNHMFAGTDEVNWAGFWLFAASIAVTAAAWILARPLVLAPIANLFGRVSNR